MFIDPITAQQPDVPSPTTGHAVATCVAGNLLVAGEPEPRLFAALEFLGTHLHPIISRELRLPPSVSWEHCILSSLIARDGLRKLGFEAEVAPTMLQVNSIHGDTLYEVAAGHPDCPRTTKGWNGHMVVLTGDMLLDVTLGQTRRPRWPHLPPMVAVPLIDPANRNLARRLTNIGAANGEFDITWTGKPLNIDWMNAPDARRHARRPAVLALVATVRQKGLAPHRGCEDSVRTSC